MCPLKSHMALPWPHAAEAPSGSTPPKIGSVQLILMTWRTTVYATIHPAVKRQRYALSVLDAALLHQLLLCSHALFLQSPSLRFPVDSEEMQAADVSPDSLIYNACMLACKRGSQGHLALQLEAKRLTTAEVLN